MEGKVFATRVWGFTPGIWPIASFGSDGICKNLLAKSAPGDVLVFVGTKGPPTPEAEQGCVLGYCMFGRDIVDTISVIDPDTLRPEAYDERGELRWPRGMVMARAWRVDLDPLPDLVATIGRQLERMATTYAVDLEADEAERVLALPVREVTLSGTERFDALRLKSERLAGRSIGPVPGSGARKGSTASDNRAAQTYVFRFGNSDCFKIGWAHDWCTRLNAVNAHVPFELLGRKWKPYLWHDWSCAEEAYAMEQRLLDALPQDRITGERVQIGSSDLEVIWARALVT
jgi:hypothetical protein